jgi:hypothetical protein
MCPSSMKMKVAFKSGEDEPGAKILPLGDATTVDPATQPDRRALARVVGVGAALLVVSAVVGAVLFRPRQEAPSATVIRWPRIESPEPPRAAAPEPETVLLSITVSPAHAQVSLDGQPMASGSFTARLPRDGNPHRIEVRAVGYQAKERVVSFLDNAFFDLTLAPLPARRAWTRRLARSSSPPQERAALSPLGLTPMRRSIEIKNPYAEDTGAAPVSEMNSIAGR